MSRVTQSGTASQSSHGNLHVLPVPVKTTARHEAVAAPAISERKVLGYTAIGSMALLIANLIYLAAS